MTIQTISKLGAEDRGRLAKAGLKLFFTLADAWGLKVDEQMLLLGLSSRSTLYSWKDRVDNGGDIKLSPDTLERLSLIAGIRKGVEILYPKDRWVAYMKQPNRHFGDQSPLDQMLLGNMSSLINVRGYLDASRGAHYG